MNAQTEANAQLARDFVTLLAQGTVPWQSPFLSTLERPHNFVGGHAYKGRNFWACFTGMLVHQWHSPRFVTFKGLQEHNKTISAERPVLIRKGEHGIRLIRMTWRNPDEDEEEGRASFSTFVVFNECQLTSLLAEPSRPPILTPPQDTLGTLLKHYPMPHPAITHHQDGAWYREVDDHVNIPPFSDFVNDEITATRNYTAVTAHELVHSTGAKTRLNRFNHTTPTLNSYGTEELIAEMGASQALIRIGFCPDLPNSAAYLQAWIMALTQTPEILDPAIRKAEKAVNYMFSLADTPDTPPDSHTQKGIHLKDEIECRTSLATL